MTIPRRRRVRRSRSPSTAGALIEANSANEFEVARQYQHERWLDWHATVLTAYRMAELYERKLAAGEGLTPDQQRDHANARRLKARYTESGRRR